ncbi:MAG: aldo/keto reductase [Bacillota bacterium]|nr:aldo/keto reductase [Bacillota bacterium]
MEYVNFGKNGLKISRFGMGCMRFLRNKNQEGKEIIDEDLAIKLVRKAIDSGINYLDTAYVYEGSEELLGKALQDGYREKVTLATKMPVWEATTYEDYEKLFNKQLERLQTDYIDVYLLHGLNQLNYDRVRKLDGTRFLDEMYAKGKIRYKGFSIHGEIDVFKKVIDYYNWDMCLIQLNFLDHKHQVGVEGLKYAASKGLSVAIMEPLKGGLLSTRVPKEAEAIWNEYPVKRNPAEWAFKWLCNMPEVSVVLSGINTFEQLEENIRIFSETQPGSMTKEEMDLIERVREVYRSKVKIGCTGCGYCMPCPADVDIPDIFKIYNDLCLFDDLNSAKMMYSLIAKEAHKDATNCLECGNCMNHCPQGIDIINKLKEVHSTLE